MTRFLFVLLLWPLAGATSHVSCDDKIFETINFTVCTVANPAKIDLHLRDDTEVIGSFRRLEALYGPQAFATNAGMYHPDRSPVGHYISEGREERRVITSAGPGKLGMLPNGIICVNTNTAKVLETNAFGVGVTESGTVVFAISNDVVNFDTFARFFRDALAAPNALYLDGRISRFHAPSLGRSDVGLPMGPILSVRP